MMEIVSKVEPELEKLIVAPTAGPTNPRSFMKKSGSMKKLSHDPEVASSTSFEILKQIQNVLSETIGGFSGNITKLLKARTAMDSHATVSSKLTEANKHVQELQKKLEAAEQRTADLHQETTGNKSSIFTEVVLLRDQLKALQSRQTTEEMQKHWEKKLATAEKGHVQKMTQMQKQMLALAETLQLKDAENKELLEQLSNHESGEKQRRTMLVQKMVQLEDELKVASEKLTQYTNMDTKLVFTREERARLILDHRREIQALEKNLSSKVLSLKDAYVTRMNDMRHEYEVQIEALQKAAQMSSKTAAAYDPHAAAAQGLMETMKTQFEAEKQGLLSRIADLEDQMSKFQTPENSASLLQRAESDLHFKDEQLAELRQTFDGVRSENDRLKSEIVELTNRMQWMAGQQTMKGGSVLSKRHVELLVAEPLRLAAISSPSPVSGIATPVLSARNYDAPHSHRTRTRSPSSSMHLPTGLEGYRSPVAASLPGSAGITVTLEGDESFRNDLSSEMADPTSLMEDGDSDVEQHDRHHAEEKMLAVFGTSAGQHKYASQIRPPSEGTTREQKQAHAAKQPSVLQRRKQSRNAGQHFDVGSHADIEENDSPQREDSFQPSAENSDALATDAAEGGKDEDGAISSSSASDSEKVSRKAADSLPAIRSPVFALPHLQHHRFGQGVIRQKAKGGDGSDLAQRLLLQQQRTQEDTDGDGIFQTEVKLPPLQLSKGAPAGQTNAAAMSLGSAKAAADSVLVTSAASEGDRVAGGRGDGLESDGGDSSSSTTTTGSGSDDSDNERQESDEDFQELVQFAREGTFFSDAVKEEPFVLEGFKRDNAQKRMEILVGSKQKISQAKKTLFAKYAEILAREKEKRQQMSALQESREWARSSKYHNHIASSTQHAHMVRPSGATLSRPNERIFFDPKSLEWENEMASRARSMSPQRVFAGGTFSPLPLGSVDPKMIAAKGRIPPSGVQSIAPAAHQGSEPDMPKGFVTFSGTALL